MTFKQFAKSFSVTAAATLALTLLSPAAAATLDLSKPADGHQAMLRLIGDIDGKPVFKDWDVTILALLPGSKPMPILRMQGYNVGRLIAKPAGSHDWVTREVSYYQDLKSGEIIESWVNPMTKQRQCIVQVANDPVSNHMVPPGANGRAPGFNLSGETGSLRMDIPLSYPNTLQPAENPEESSGPSYLASEHFIFFAKRADLISDTQSSTLAHHAWFRTGPWLPWMKMGQTPGYLIYSGQGNKYASFNELPATVKAYTLKHFPSFVTAPDSFYQPNETSWTYYAKLKKAGKLPEKCD
ncbi:MAG: DUF1838 family protein [Burkholderiales bacterium]|nr:DUF1838 family protein [Burkholderiales bacterium]